MRTEWLVEEGWMSARGRLGGRSGPIISWQIDVKTMETVRDFILGVQNNCRW